MPSPIYAVPTVQPPLTEAQIRHRQYLESETWKFKRVAAFAHYGHNCNRCGKPGTDVHHKNYARVGGMEKMSDLEILCRPCHEEHHRNEKARIEKKIRHKSLKKRRSRIDERLVCARLTGEQRAMLRRVYHLSNHQLNIDILSQRTGIYGYALRLVKQTLKSERRRKK